MNKKWVFIAIGLLVMVGIGVKVFSGNKNSDNKEYEKIQEVQKEIALYLVQNYKNVEKIEFSKVSKREGVGYLSWVFPVVINDDNYISFSLTNLSKVDDATTRHNPKTFDLEEVDEDLTKDLKEVEVIYWAEN